MSYEQYETKGFLLRVSPWNENGKIALIYTECFGLLSVLCQGARKGASKLNRLLEGPSYSSFALIRGREWWRLVGGEEGECYWRVFGSDREKLQMLTRIFAFLSRFLHGEGGNEKLFITLSDLSSYIGATPRKMLPLLEAAAVARILSALGYFPDDASYERLLNGGPFSEGLLLSLQPNMAGLYADINRSIKESHL